MANHTQGQWAYKVARNGDVGLIAPGTGVFGEFYADIRHEGENNCDEALANAKIAVAAVGMLAALKLADANSHEPADEPWRVAVKAAIAKAEG